MSTRAYTASSKTLNPRVTPQSQKVAGKNQVFNHSAGAVFQLSKWSQLNRFLILGSEGGAYVIGERALTKENASNALACIAEDGMRVVNVVVEISDSGRAPKNDPALFVLALCASFGTAEVRKYALDNLQKFARIGTHLFHFAEYVNSLRGWGHGLRKAVARWYTERRPEGLATQLVKYQSRDGWSHRDVLRLAHPRTADVAKNLAIRWAVKGLDASKGVSLDALKSVDALGMIYGFEQVKSATTEKEVLELVARYKLPLEAIPTEKQTSRVLAQALPNMGITAIIRNLGRFSKSGILTATSAETNYVVEQILDADVLREGRVHPLQLLFALKTYQSGRGFRGSSTWEVVSKIVDAVDEGFYMSFGVVEPTNRRICIALDISGTMGGAVIANSNITAREASVAMSMVTARVEKNYEVVGFTSGGSSPYVNKNGRGGWGGVDGITPLDVSPRRRMDDLMRYTASLPMGGTDCALPMLYAMDTKKKFDAFVVYTDNETWAGTIHPFQALKMYRDASGINARLIVVGMTSTGFTIADPSDAGMLDVVGFDTSAPNVMSSFIRGEM